MAAYESLRAADREREALADAIRRAADDCARWHALDARFGTDPRSPLHHDNRCRLCR